jgi:mutator protein MutT
MFSRRVSCFTLRDESGRILLQHRDSGAPRCPEMWAFFGGEIERGETPERALRREAREELGIELDSPELFGTFEFQEDGMHQKFLFVCPLTLPLEQIRSQQAEGDRLDMFLWNEIRGLPISESDLAMVRALFNKPDG